MTNHAIRKFCKQKIIRILASLKNNQSFNSTADFFRSFYIVTWAKTFTSRGKIQRFISSRQIGVKWYHFKISRVFTPGWYSCFRFIACVLVFSLSLSLSSFYVCGHIQRVDEFIACFKTYVFFFLKAAGRAAYRRKKRGLQHRVWVSRSHGGGTYVRTDGSDVIT